MKSLFLILSFLFFTQLGLEAAHGHMDSKDSQECSWCFLHHWTSSGVAEKAEIPSFLLQDASYGEGFYQSPYSVQIFSLELAPRGPPSLS